MINLNRHQFKNHILFTFCKDIISPIRYLNKDILISSDECIDTYSKPALIGIAINYTASVSVGAHCMCDHTSHYVGRDSWLCVAGREQVIQILPECVIIRTFAARTVTNVRPTSTSCK